MPDDRKYRIIIAAKIIIVLIFKRGSPLHENAIPLGQADGSSVKGHCIMQRYYLIDHRHLFFFGFVFYLFTPYLAGVVDAFSGLPGMELYQGFFRQVPKAQLSAYCWISISWLAAFYLGHAVFGWIHPKKQALFIFPSSYSSQAVNWLAPLLLLVLIIFTWISRNSLFGNYEVYDSGARGKMSSLLVVFNFFLLYQLLSRQRISILLVTGTVLTALLLLSMGGRMYVIQTFVIYLVFRSSFSMKRWKLRHIILFAIAALLTGSWVGIYRMGSSFNPVNASYSFFAEPVFTWFSTATFLIGNDIPLINFPWNFITSFFNLVPNSIVSLQPYVVSVQDMGYTYLNPLGADSIWTTVIINFGALGSFFFIFITGFMLHFLRSMSERRRFAAAYYILVCGILPFQFFRDGFYIINKQLFFNFLLLPAIILYCFKMLQYLQTAVIPNFRLSARSAN